MFLCFVYLKGSIWVLHSRHLSQKLCRRPSKLIHKAIYIFSLRKFGLYLWAATEKRDQYMKMSSTRLILLCFVWRAYIRTPKLSQQFSCSFFNYLNMLLKSILTGSQLFCRTVSQKTAWKTAGRWKNLSSPATGAQHCASLTPASHCAGRDHSATACDVWSLTGATSTC